jgi:hypothetical protein
MSYEDLSKKFEVNPLRGEHLKPEYSPLIIGMMHERDVDEEILANIEKIMRDGINIDYYSLRYSRIANNILGATAAYMISPVDKRDKYSNSYFSCTGIICIGKSKDTEDNISLMTHQNPSRILTDTGQPQGLFQERLEERISEFKNQVIEGSIDVVILGGNYFTKKLTDNFQDPDVINKEQYINQILYLGKLLKGEFGFEPIVAVGPNFNKEGLEGETEIFLDTEKRRIYFIRENQPTHSVNKAFLPSQIQQVSNSWDKIQE